MTLASVEIALIRKTEGERILWEKTHIGEKHPNERLRDYRADRVFPAHLRAREVVEEGKS